MRWVIEIPLKLGLNISIMVYVDNSWEDMFLNGLVTNGFEM